MRVPPLQINIIVHISEGWESPAGKLCPLPPAPLFLRLPFPQVPTNPMWWETTFCVGAHCTDGNGWLPAESSSAANHQADGEAATLLRARLPGFSAAVRGWRQPSQPRSFYQWEGTQQALSKTNHSFCPRSVVMVKSAKKRPRVFLDLEERDRTAPKPFKQ